MGKLGAFIGSYCFKPIIASLGGSGTYRGDTGPFWVRLLRLPSLCLPSLTSSPLYRTRALLQIASCLALFSAAIVWFFVPDIGPDYMQKEDIAFRAYLEENGWDTSEMGSRDLRTVSPELGESKAVETVHLGDEKKL